MLSSAKLGAPDHWQADEGYRRCQTSAHEMLHLARRSSAPTEPYTYPCY